MAKYETMLITSAALDEEATAALVGNQHGFVLCHFCSTSFWT